MEGGGGKVQNIGGGGGGARGTKLFAGCKLIGAPAPNQCQIIAFLTLKTDNIAKLRIEIKSILLEIPSNKIKGTYMERHGCLMLRQKHMGWSYMLM